jgi:hypothetical protein
MKTAPQDKHITVEKGKQLSVSQRGEDKGSSGLLPERRCLEL